MTLKQAESSAEVEGKLSALVTNANAIRAVSNAVEGTIGPKGLDTMLVDRFGEVIITNDGVTILDKMEVDHPAARLLIHIAKAQQAEIGDGTTTATIMAAALVTEGLDQVIRGVPVTKVIEGIKFGIAEALAAIKANGRQVEHLNDRMLKNIAIVAGREYGDIANLVIEAANLIGKEKLCESHFKLSDIISSQECAENQVFMGVVIHKQRMSTEMPKHFHNAKVLSIDDALQCEEISSEALGTEAGFQKYMDLQNEFKVNVQKIIDLKVNVVLVDRNVSEVAEEMFTDAGIMVLRRVEHMELERVAEHVGARLIKRTGIKKANSDIEKYIGYASEVYEDERLKQVRILGGKGKPMATVLVGAATKEVAGERERIAKDAASSVQATVKGGYISGGGSIEIAVARQVQTMRQTTKGMSAYGTDCVVHALKRPLSQIVENAGFNQLEKVEEVISAQIEHKCNTLGIDCDTGKVVDMLELGVVDPMLVKYHAIKAAGEVAVAILRIDKIIRKVAEGSADKVVPMPDI
ncbi:MAG: groL1 [Massilibacillus sp.]|jgi:chaperonin GroEL (HSP60 family)|nr:groL1 [Massilibacillus sp.]